MQYFTYLQYINVIEEANGSPKFWRVECPVKNQHGYKLNCHRLIKIYGKH